MPDGFTHLNLSEVEDSAPKFGFEEHQEARFASEALATEQTASACNGSSPVAGRASATATRRPRRSTWCSPAAAG